MAITIGRNRKILLSVGIDSYPMPYDLRSCVNDMNDLCNTLRLKNFSIRTLSNNMATRSEILAQLTRLVQEAVSGNTISFGFFGHGSTVNGHQCICPVDVLTNGPIMDYEIANIFSGLKDGVKLEVILGSCYSGGATSNTNIPNESIHISKPYFMPLEGSIESSSSNIINNNLGYVLWAACREDQNSWEVVADGVYRGLYPVYLCWALQTYPNYTRRQIDQLVTSLVLAVVSTQEPQLICSSIKLDQLPFT